MSNHWWQRPEGGGRFGLWLIFTIARVCGRPLTRLILYPVTLYFYLRRGHERQATRVLLARFGLPNGTWSIMAHMHRFASTLLDRVFFLARGEHGFAISVDGLDELKAVLDHGRGVLLLGAHMGSFEVLRALASRHPDAPALRIVLNTQQTPVLTRLLGSLAPDVAAAIIDAAQDPVSVVLAVSEALEQGHPVALLADRGHPGESMRHIPFCGLPAPFPTGPWILAARTEVPVVLCLGLYQGGNHYQVIFEPFADTVSLPRAEREHALEAVMTRYAARLEHYARQVPCNWFNFYDFWDEDADAGKALGTRGL
ncbi:MAG TPA: acyltransferase [Rhodanobacteraceae bacterium]